MTLRSNIIDSFTHSRLVGFNSNDHTATYHTPAHRNNATTNDNSNKIVILLGWSGSIKNQIEYYKKQGNKIESHNFIDSPHVAHLKFYREKYMELMNKFIESSSSSSPNR